MSTPARPVRSFLIGAIRLYQGLHAGRLSPCRFTPSCSEFAIEAIKTKGAVRGGALAIWRIARCNPLGGRGFDPVPS